MNQKRKTILAMVFFVLFIVVVSFLYTTLKDYYKQKQTLEKPQQTTEKKNQKFRLLILPYWMQRVIE